MIAVDTNVRTLLLISVAAIIGIVAGLDVTPSRPTVVPDTADRVCASPPIPSLDSSHASAAMLSIHAHSYHADRRMSDQELASLPLMKLTHAAWVIRCGRGPRADSRRRRAIAELLAYGHVGDRAEHDDALAMLGVSDADLQDVIGALAPGTGTTATTLPAAVDAAELEFLLLWIVPDLLDRLVNPFADDAEATCHWSPAAAYAPKKDESGTTILDAKVWLDQDVAFAARSFSRLHHDRRPRAPRSPSGRLRRPLPWARNGGRENRRVGALPRTPPDTIVAEVRTIVRKGDGRLQGVLSRD